MDLFRIAKELNISLEDVIDRYCELYAGYESRFPLVRLKPRGVIKRCPLLKNRKCSVHKAKPAMCAMFPIGRAVEFSEDERTSSKTSSIQYFYTDPGCGMPGHRQSVSGLTISASHSKTIFYWMGDISKGLLNPYKGDVKRLLAKQLRGNYGVRFLESSISAMIRKKSSFRSSGKMPKNCYAGYGW